MNQRSYYQKHKAKEQAKARIRASKNRKAAKNISTLQVDEGYDTSTTNDDHEDDRPLVQVSTTLVPVRSPLFAPSFVPLHSHDGNSRQTVPSTLSQPIMPEGMATANSHMPTTLTMPPPPINDHLLPEPNSIDWASWSARHHMISLRRWLLDLEWKWGNVDRWPAQCMDEWHTIRGQSLNVVEEWFEERQRRLVNGRLLLGYLGRVIEGQLPSDVGECRDLYVQSHQLARALYTGVIGLEHQLHSARLELSNGGCICEKGSMRE